MSDILNQPRGEYGFPLVPANEFNFRKTYQLELFEFLNIAGLEHVLDTPTPKGSGILDSQALQRGRLLKHPGYALPRFYLELFNCLLDLLWFRVSAQGSRSNIGDCTTTLYRCALPRMHLFSHILVLTYPTSQEVGLRSLFLYQLNEEADPTDSSPIPTSEDPA